MAGAILANSPLSVLIEKASAVVAKPAITYRDDRTDLAYLSSLAAVLNARLEERSLLDGAFTGTIDNVTPITPFRASGAIPDGQDFIGTAQVTTMIVTIDPVSGGARYLVGGKAPTPTNGLVIPSGGGVFRVRGMFNISTFTLIATTATPVLFSCQIFSRASYDGHR